MRKDLEEINKEILDTSWKLDVEERRLKDRNLLKKLKAERDESEQQAHVVKIDISIAESRISDLNNQKKMTED